MSTTRFDLLLDSYLNGPMEPAAETEFHQLLQGDAGLRKRFAESLLLDIQLRKAFAAPVAPCLPLQAPKRSRRVVFRWATAAVVLVGVGLATLGLHDRRAGAATEELLAKEELLERINAERTKRHFTFEGKTRRIPKLREDEALRQVALEHARELSRKRVKSILEPDVNRELEEAGYSAQFWGLTMLPGAVVSRPSPPAPTARARRRAQAPSTSGLSEVCETWLNQKNQQPVAGLPHPSQVLLNPFHEDAGIAVYRDSESGKYYVFVLLGKKKLGPAGGSTQPADVGRAVRGVRYPWLTIQPLFHQGVSS